MAITIEPAPKAEPTISKETQRRLIAVSIRESTWPRPEAKGSMLTRIFRALFTTTDR